MTSPRHLALAGGLAFALVATLVTLGCPQESEPAGSADAASTVRNISPEDLLSDPPDEAILLDVRTEKEFATGHVPGARNIPHTELAQRLDELAAVEDQPVVVYCETGGRAGRAAEVLLASGYTDVRHLEGDMSAWRAAGRPMEIPTTTEETE